MSFDGLLLGHACEFLNGKAPVISDNGEFVVYGSNGPIGRSKDFNHENAIILGRVGAYCGSVKICNDKFWASDNTIVVKPQGTFDLIYLYYRLLSTQLRTFAGGAAQPLLTHTILRGVRIRFEPDKTKQIKIGTILKWYDDLIENNRRRIQLLEQSARLLYKEWFVRLRFPGHEHVKIKDGVPEGWVEKAVADLCSYLNRGITPKYNDSAVGVVVNQKCIRDRLINLELARRQSKEVPQKKLLRFGDILVNSTGEGTLGRIAQVTFDVDNCTVDSHITIVRPANDVPIYYFGLFLTGLESFFSTMGRGATNQTELARSTIGEIRILLPPSALSKEFEDIVSPVYQLINRTVLQSKKLAEARDLLLPRLMSGEIEV